MWATKDTPVVSTPAFVESRMGPFKRYSSKMVAVWAWGDVGEPGLKTLQEMEKKWAPWIPQLRAFLEAEDRG